MAESASDCVADLKSIPDDVSILYIPESSDLSQKAQEKGLNYYTQCYIHDIKILDEFQPKVNARCWRSMRKNDTAHKLHIQICLKTKQLSEAHCSCKAGLCGHCSHVIGLLKTLQGFKLHNLTSVPEQQSCTSIPRQWGLPRGMKIKPLPMSHVVVERPTVEVRKRKPILCQFDTEKKLPLVESSDVKKLVQLDGTPLGYILSEDRPTVDTPFGKVQTGSLLSYQTRNFKKIKVSVGTGCGNTTLPKTAHVKLADEYIYLNDDFSLVDLKQLEIQTQGQASCQLWKTSRAKRITSSNFGKILQRKSVPSSKFLENLFNHKNISAAPLEYGRRNEPKAKAKYLELYDTRHIHECGLVVNKEFLFLGASPDGKVCDNNECGIIEVKCPYTARDHTINQAVDELQNFVLRKEGDSLILPQNHQYYDQVQGQLMVTGSKFCDFVVYTNKDLHVQRIFPNTDHMQNMLQKLSLFYMKYAKPYLAELVTKQMCN